MTKEVNVKYDCRVDSRIAHSYSVIEKDYYMSKEFVKKELVPLLLRIGVLAVIFVAVAINYDRLVNIDVRALVDAAPGEALAIAIAVGIFGLKGFTFVIPAMLIYVSVGMAFDTVTAVLISLAGIALEVAVTYWLGRALGGDYVTRLLSKVKGGDKILGMKNTSKFSTVFVVRLVALPIDFSSLFFGSMKLPFLRYLLFSVLGIAPRVVLFTLLGDGIYEIIPMHLLLKLVLIILPVAAIGFVIRWVIARKKKAAKAKE